jgi:hypothetical protein
MQVVRPVGKVLVLQCVHARTVVAVRLALRTVLCLRALATDSMACSAPGDPTSIAMWNAFRPTCMHALVTKVLSMHRDAASELHACTVYPDANPTINAQRIYHLSHGRPRRERPGQPPQPAGNRQF